MTKSAPSSAAHLTCSRGLTREAKGLAVERLEIVLAADGAELLAVAVVGEGDHDLGAGAEELAVELPHRVGEVEDYLGHVRPALQVAAALELEEVALGAEDGVARKSFDKRAHGSASLPSSSRAKRRDKFTSADDAQHLSRMKSVSARMEPATANER